MKKRKFWHPSLTDEVITEAAERRMTSLDNPGFCLACGCEQGGCEPDAREYECESCGESQVYGAEELLLVQLPAAAAGDRVSATLHHLRQRVVVTAPHRPEPMHGQRIGEYTNRHGKWVSVILDGTRTLSWFWHEYVREEAKDGSRS